jgi:hypothetical protein
LRTEGQKREIGAEERAADTSQTSRAELATTPNSSTIA